MTAGHNMKKHDMVCQEQCIMMKNESMHLMKISRYYGNKTKGIIGVISDE